MGSRLKPNPEQTFHWFFEATCPVARDKDPGVSFQFPEDFSDEESCHTLPRFCFPYDIQRVRDAVGVQHFTFVLTDLQGCQRFGFCRLANSTHTCLCMLSYLPWFEVFYKLLNNVADFLSKGQTSEVKSLLAALYRQPLPLAAGSVTLQMGEQVLLGTEASSPVEGREAAPYFIAPDPRSLPSIPENRNLTELIVAVDVGNLLQLYASMLFERRILIFASKLSTLTSCVHALSAVLYPMYWQHIFIPVLPPHLLDYCCAPTPYLIGVHSSLSEWVRSRDLEEVVILNVDSNTLETPFDDFKRIPSDVMSGLKACLKRQAVSRGCGVSRAFLKAQALLFGGYRDALQTLQDEVGFSEEIFLDHKSSSMKQFLQSAIHLQFFKQFIDCRLDVLNSGKEPQDLFEEEILKCEMTEGRSKSYQQLVGNLKKGGGALILNMKSKANVRAKNFAKSGLKKLLHHKQESSEELGLQRGGSVSHRRAQSDCLQDRLPISHHYGMSRPRRPFNKSRNPRDKDRMKDTGESWDGAVSGPAAEPDSELQEDEEEENTLFSDPEEMDLLGEIFDSLSSRSSYDRGVLYGTRSLDLFGPDSHDYITKHGTASPSQESLALSVSGSLHSWNVETTEELSDLAEDSDWLCPDSSVPEEEADELQAAGEVEERGRGRRKGGVKWDEVNGNQEEETDKTSNCQEVNLQWETRVEGRRGGSEEDPLNGLMEEQEDQRLKDQKASEHYRDEEEREMEGKATEMQKQEGGEDGGEDGIETDEEQRGAAPVEEQQGRPETERTTSREPPSAAAAGQRAKSGEEEREARHTPPPPKVQSAKARFQTAGPGQGVPVNSRIKALAEPRRPCEASRSLESELRDPPCHPETKSRSEASPEEDGRPPVKVSELKKRFEA